MALLKDGHERNPDLEEYPKKLKKTSDILLLWFCSLSFLDLFHAVLQGSTALLNLVLHKCRLGIEIIMYFFLSRALSYLS